MTEYQPWMLGEFTWSEFWTLCMWFIVHFVALFWAAVTLWVMWRFKNSGEINAWIKDSRDRALARSKRAHPVLEFLVAACYFTYQIVCGLLEALTALPAWLLRRRRNK